VGQSGKLPHRHLALAGAPVWMYNHAADRLIVLVNIVGVSFVYIEERNRAEGE
jgi:hypothetical protein